MATKKTKLKKVLKNTDLSLFCSQLAIILKSGISVTEGLHIIYDDTENFSNKELIKALLDDCEIGIDFSTALLNSDNFPKYLVDMVEIGEKTGKLDEVLYSLAEYYNREDTISKNIRQAITYPCIMVFMMIMVIGVLVIKVLPIFNSVFVQLGSQLTGFAKTVMDLGVAISTYSVVIVIVLGVFAIACILIYNTKKGKLFLEKFKAHFFLTKKLSAKTAASRFANGMSLMLSSGLDTDQSLDMVHKLIDNPLIKQKIEQCQQQIAEGKNFAEAISDVSIFSNVYSRMVTIGFKTGTMDEVMTQISSRYEQEVDTSLSNTISILEPSLVAFLSVVIGMILLSVMLPLMGIMSSIS